jgi:hypothetical protein
LSRSSSLRGRVAKLKTERPLDAGGLSQRDSRYLVALLALKL